MVATLPGLERIKDNFLSLLVERQAEIAENALAAWESTDADGQALKLKTVQNLLHQITGSAGTLGFGELGSVAQKAEGAIIAYLEGNDRSNAAIPHTLLAEIDGFVSVSQSLLLENGYASQ